MPHVNERRLPIGRSIRIARLFGIDIQIHPSWFVILAVVVWSVGTSWFAVPGWTTTTVWTVSVAAALLLFASVLLHELAHSLVARGQGIEVRSITLFLLGGVSTFEDEASSPGREALMAGAGPATSAVIGAAAWWAGAAISGPEQLTRLLVYLGFINVVLAVFNLLPGLPLDGGRILHAVIWKAIGDKVRATRAAAICGLVLGWLLIALAAYSLFVLGDTSGGIWTALIGWTLVQAAGATRAQARATTRLGDATVGEVMTPTQGWVPGALSLQRAIDEYFIPFRARYLPVVDDEGRLEGVISAEDLQRVHDERRGTMPVRDLMTPFADLRTMSPETGIGAVLDAMRDGATPWIVVIAGDELVGFVDHASLSAFVERGGRLN